ncbi:MAG: hypothetical protein U0326_26110 [Polyangiales bacterium]
MLALVALAIASCVPYLRTWRYGFVHLDDHQFVVEGAWFFREWGNIPRVFTNDVWEFFGESSSLYRPLLLLPRFVEMWLFGTEPGPYHVLNTGLHFASVALFFALLREVIGGVAWPFVWAMLFALHPAHVPVVAWIEGYNNSMLAAFVLAALLLALRALKTGARAHVFGSAAAFFMALLTKENAVCVPILCALHLGDGRALLARHLIARLLAGAWLVALLAWILLRANAIASTPEFEPGYILGSIARNHRGLVLYWGKIFLPINLAPLPTLQDSSMIPGLAAIALYAAIVAVSDGPARRALGFGALWFLLLIGPSLLVNRLMSPSGAIFREDRLYHAALGPMLALAVASKDLSLRRPREVFALVVGCVLGSLALGQVVVGRYSDGLAFFSAAAAHSPHLASAHAHLADRYVERGDFEAARREYELALTLNPACPTLNNNFALLLMHDGDFERADRHFQAEVVVNPGFLRARYNRGVLYGRRGDYRAAAMELEQYLALGPSSREEVLMARLGLIDCYNRLHQPEQARRVAADLSASGATIVPRR